MKKWTKIVVCIIIVSFILLELAIPICNNLIASNIVSILKDTPLPDNTEIIDSVSKAGKLTGNGNGMQYFAAILIKSKLSDKELIDYYSKFRNNEFEYIVEKQTSNQIEEIEHGNLSFDKVELTSDLSNYYIVYSWGDINNEILGFDLRGH